MQQRQRTIMTAAAVVVGLLIVAVVAEQQLTTPPAPSQTPAASQVVVVVSSSPAPTGSSGVSPASPGTSALASGAPSPSGIELFVPGPANSTPSTIPVHARILGDTKATVAIDLYGDFRCSACYVFTEGGTAAAINRDLIATGIAKMIWHDFLVIDFRDNSGASRDAANAAWCAADQDKFWTMHDWLYVNQSPTEDPSAFSLDRLLAIGQAAGMDMATFAPCVEQGTHNANIALEQTMVPPPVANNGTPSVLVNGKFVNASYADIAKAVKAAAEGAPHNPSPSR